MLTRLLIVLLAILNVGVALWWMLPRAAPAAVPAATEAGVATLELLPAGAPAAEAAQEAVAPTATVAPTPTGPVPSPAAAPIVAQTEQAAVTPVAAPEPTPAAAKPVVTEQCVSLGPFTSQAQAQSAMAALGTQAARPRVREVAGKAASSYRVLIAPAASREEAQATAKRIVEAGFSDYFVVSQGEEANAVALGQYRNREGAERRLAALTAAGFPARLATSGNEVLPSWWIDTATAGNATQAALKQRSAAAQQQSLDCSRLR